MAKSGAIWSGWVQFAGVMMALIGAFNLFEGLAAIFSDDYFVRSEDTLLVLDFTGWGVTMLIWGAVLIISGLALLAGREWARWVAVAVVALNALGHMAFMGFPVWNALVVGLSVAVIFALTVRWRVAQDDMNG
ncbi:MAG TPA: hypothetical protein PKE32_06405 [Miltoncostaeaceae bacterium]|nr:hypothetical protein [Miltoncostaeaceae bacterium]